MKTVVTAWSLVVLLALSACDGPKARHPKRVDQPATDAVGETPAISAGLSARPEFPGFYLDSVGSAFDPLKTPAVIDGREPVDMAGFAFDTVAKVPAKGVDLDIDGRLFGTRYGSSRPDVATFNKNPALVPTGYRTTLPAGTLKPGPHRVIVRVVSADGKTYYQSPAIRFTVR